MESRASFELLQVSNRRSITDKCYLIYVMSACLTYNIHRDVESSLTPLIKDTFDTLSLFLLKIKQLKKGEKKAGMSMNCGAAAI